MFFTAVFNPILYTKCPAMNAARITKSLLLDGKDH